MGDYQTIRAVGWCLPFNRLRVSANDSPKVRIPARVKRQYSRLQVRMACETSSRRGGRGPKIARL